MLLNLFFYFSQIKLPRIVYVYKVLPILVILLTFLSNRSLAQEKFNIIKLQQATFTHHQQSYQGNKAIHFLIAGDSSQLKKRKPIFLFCQGSLPNPLIIKTEQGEAGVFPFAYQNYIKDYHLVIISKPGIPIAPKANTLDQRYCYRDSLTNVFPSTFLTNNYTDYYVNSTNIVIDYLYQQPNIDTSQIIIAGHSQGAKIATQVANSNPRVTHLIYLSGNPLGRFDELIRKERTAVKQGKKTAEEAQEAITQLYKHWERIWQTPKATDKYWGDTHYAWSSFSQPIIEDLLALDIPIWLGYGTADYGSEFCDLIPLYFIQAGKSNLNHHPYVNLEHNFFTVDQTGTPQYEKEPAWDQIATDFFKWINQTIK